MGFEERISAAFQDATVAAAAVQAAIETDVELLSTSWNAASEEADSLGAQGAAISAVASEYRKELESFSSTYPDVAPQAATPSLLPDPPVRLSAQGWAVGDQITGGLRNELAGAQLAASQASQKMFAGRQRSEAQVKATSVLGTVNALEAEETRVAEAAKATLERRDAKAETDRIEADRRLASAMSRLANAERSLPPSLRPWSDRGWLSWSPELTHAHIRLGALSLEPGQVPGPNHDFAWNARVPTFVSIREALQIRHIGKDRPTAHALVRSLILRALACTPPGKLRLSIFDPLGLGQSVSSVLELAEYDRDLIGGKVWSSGEDLNRVLAEHTAHIELVIQKYLRAEYATLEEFNSAAGEIAEPYRLLVVLDSPSAFDERSLGELRRVIENGPRCGVATLLATDESIQPSSGVSFDIPGPMRSIGLNHPDATEDGVPSGVAFAIRPETDADTPKQVIASIVDQVGKAAQKSTSSAVSFEKVFSLFAQAALEGRKRGLPRLTSAIDLRAPDSWWKQSSVESVSAPIGQRGARDVATLTFDSSDHSGALLVGRPGSGKSTLLHTFIGGITTMHGPDELELHLIDFKEGVEFKVYAAGAMPHARTVAIESDREFGVSVLQAIQAELSWRGSLLRGSSGSHSSLETMRKATGERLPRIVLIFDEFQVLFARNDKLGGIAAEALETLIRQGRGFGIHVLLGSQSLSGLDALGSHVPQLLPVRILLPAADSDAFKVLGEGNSEGSALTNAGEGILNTSGGSVEANERFRGAVIDEESRRTRVATMREKADSEGFGRRPVVFEGNAPIPAEDTSPARFADEVRGGDARTLRLRFGAPMAIAGSADIDLRRESGANVLMVARDTPIETVGPDQFSVPRAVMANVVLSAVARRASVDVVDFLPIDEGPEDLIAPLADAGAINVHRRRQVPDLLQHLQSEVEQRVSEDDSSGPLRFLMLYGMHRARDFDQDSVDYDAEAGLPDLLGQVMRDGPEVGVHTFLWFDTVAGIGRRLSASTVREASWRLAGKMSEDDSVSFTGVDSAGSLREQQLLAVNEDRGLTQRCTTIAEPSGRWIQDLLSEVKNNRKEPMP